MIRYLGKRFLQTILVLFIVVTLIFVLLRCIGDPTKLLISPESTWEDITFLQEYLGLDKPMHVQYFEYLKQIVTGDLGNSFYYQRPIVEIIKEHAPATLLLAGVSFLVSVPMAILAGTIAAVKRKTALDNLVTSITIAGRSVPHFWYGLLLILLFSVTLKWLPASGYGTAKHLIMPVLTLSSGLAASTARLTRSSMLEVMRQDYMTTARAKGVLETRVVLHHGLRNALLTVVTMVSLQLGSLLGGSVVVESVFAWPGIGRLMINGILNYDYPLVQACAMIMALLFAVINLVTDLLYTVIDPSIRYH